jgi:hypothetical protein
MSPVARPQGEHDVILPFDKGRVVVVVERGRYAHIGRAAAEGELCSAVTIEVGAVEVDVIRKNLKATQTMPAKRSAGIRFYP